MSYNSAHIFVVQQNWKRTPISFGIPRQGDSTSRFPAFISWLEGVGFHAERTVALAQRNPAHQPFVFRLQLGQLLRHTCTHRHHGPESV